MYEKYEQLDIKNSDVELNKNDKIILCLWALYFVLKPFYLWSSGLPQISDMLMVLVISLFCWIKRNHSLRTVNRNMLIFALFFVFYTTVVNLVWSMILSTTDMISSSVYLIYNFIILFTTSMMLDLYKRKFIVVTYYAVFISVTVQFSIYLFQGGLAVERNTAAFNNPNQLGYYTLLIISFLIFCSTKIKHRLVVTLTGIFFGLILVFSSLSKAAILSYTGLVVIYLFNNLINRKYWKKMLLAILAIVGIYLVIDSTTNYISDSPLLQSVEKRMTSIGGDSDDSLEGRGYDRIINYPEYGLIGSGEGGYQRFLGFLQGGELHSTLGNIQMSYGIIGSILFLLLLYQSVKGKKKKSLYIIFFILLYGLTHNGLRNSFFWVLLALMGLDDRYKKDN